MADFAGPEALKNFPILQLIVGGMVALVTIALTLRGARDNKKDAHIAPQGHDPYGLVVMGNSLLAQVSVVAEQCRRMAGRLDDLNDEAVKTNARLAEMSDRHDREMDRLRDTIEGVGRKR